MDRGSEGRPVDAGFPSSLLYDELRLMAGLCGLEDAGDCWEGGVYGISPPRDEDEGGCRLEWLGATSGAEH